MVRLAGCCCLVLLLSGCADLILRDTDTAGEQTGKVAARILLCPITICFSELDIAMTKEREARGRWLQSISQEEREQYYRLEAARIQAAGQSLLGIGISGGPLRSPVVVPQQPAIQAAPIAPVVTMPPVSCSTYADGGMVTTNCY